MKLFVTLWLLKNVSRNYGMAAFQNEMSGILVMLVIKDTVTQISERKVAIDTGIILFHYRQKL